MTDPQTSTDPGDSTQRQSFGPSTEHDTRTRNLELTLDRFCTLQEEQLRLLRESLGKPTPISQGDPWDWEHEICAPHPCYCCRSQPHYRQIFGFHEGDPLRREKDLELEKDPDGYKAWIQDDTPRSTRQEWLKDAFVELLPAHSSRNTEWWPDAVLIRSPDTLSEVRWEDRVGMREALRRNWQPFFFPNIRANISSEPIIRSEGVQVVEHGSGGQWSVYEPFNITDQSATWKVNTTGADDIQGSENMIPYQTNESSDKIVNGRHVECSLKGEFITFWQISLFCCIFSNIISQKSDLTALVQVLEAYTSAWKPTRQIKVASSRLLFQHFHFRYPEVCLNNNIDEPNPGNGHTTGWIRCSRDKGKMPKSPERITRQTIVERRVSLLFATTNLGPSRPWKILTLADKRVYEPDTTLKSMEELLRQRMIKKPSERFFALLNTLRKELDTCVGFWGQTLDQLEKDLRISIDKVTEGNTLKTWMFDGDENERSELYFECLSMLQIFFDWVEDTSRDLSTTVNAIPSEYFPALGLVQEEIKGIKIGVESFLKEIEDGFGPITARIKQTQEEICVLRDGMFNSTSIREAREATHQGQYIHVFTIITIVYLPLGFVTGFFGMNILESVNASFLTSWTPFIVVFTVVAATTYALAGLSIPWVHWNDISRKFIAFKKQLMESRPVHHGGRGGDAV